MQGQCNDLNAKRRPSDITREAHGDSAAPVSNGAGIPGACDSLEVRFDQGEQAQRRKPPRPDSSVASSMKY